MRTGGLKIDNEGDWQDYLDWQAEQRGERDADEGYEPLDHWDWGVPAPGTLIEMGGW